MIYRVWVKDEKRMIVGDQKFLPLIITNVGILKLNPHHEENLYNIIPYSDSLIPMRSAGLKDKNKRDVFEGDILKVMQGYREHEDDEIEYRTLIGVITFERGNFWFNGSGWAIYSWHSYNDSDLEVLGNIYENPDLLDTYKGVII